ncbi:MAG TPA: signal peptidase I [Candidatus Angelobacter sp.]|nr:signal peptidase I [Candidatus Angelobacter sp.]
MSPYEAGEQVSASTPAVQPNGQEQPAAAGPQGETQVPASSATQTEPAQGPRGIQFIISVLVIVVFMITFVVQAFRVPSESMENTLLIGDFLLADKMHYANGGGIWHWLLPYRPIRRGDIVVFHYPVDPSQYFVKRVIGLPGDHIRLQNKMVFVNGSQLQESYVIHTMPDLNMYRDDFPLHAGIPPDVDRRWRRELYRHIDHGELVVPPGEYFVMGDNRDQSLDSRYWGFVPRGNIMGRPLVIYLSVNNGGLTGAHAGHSDGKLIKTGQVLAHFLQMARWDRIFHRVL